MNLDPVILAELMRGGPPPWVSGRTYPVGAVVRSPGNLQSYVRVTAGAGNTDPSGDDANWMILSKRVEDAVAVCQTAVGTSRNAVQGTVNAARDDVKATVTNARDNVNGNVYAARDQVQATVNAARDAVWAQVVACHTTVGDVKDIVNWVRALVEGSGVNVQRGIFGGYYVNRQLPYYDMPISPVNPARAFVNWLTTEFGAYNTGSHKSIALAPDGTAVRVYVKAGGTDTTTIPQFSWEVIEWKR